MGMLGCKLWSSRILYSCRISSMFSSKFSIILMAYLLLEVLSTALRVRHNTWWLMWDNILLVNQTICTLAYLLQQVILEVSPLRQTVDVLLGDLPPPGLHGAAQTTALAATARHIWSISVTVAGWRQQRMIARNHHRAPEVMLLLARLRCKTSVLKYKPFRVLRFLCFFALISYP